MLIVTHRLIQAENTLGKANKTEKMNKVKQLKSIGDHYIYNFKSDCDVHAVIFFQNDI
ncbi:hypothetical protein Fmac_016947 [Flemingia macrophylla]|uniref:Uncharacterized protein n=1 Tax=Flemingia macrophylla TaxID=520843 RepID=A0ABD1MJ03_9FABA